MATPGSSADEELVTRVAGVSMLAPTLPHATLDRGARFGRYLVIEELGQGGMGRVLRAYDPRLQREVALKVLRAEVMDPLGRARMVREARTMAMLSHPNVVAVYDVDDDPEHGVMVAMELVEGSTLQQWLRESPRAWRDVLAAFVEAGRGLSAAHDQGMLHRDFKPANVLVARGTDGTAGRGPCKVTDFGLAKAEHDTSSSSASRGRAQQGSTSGDDTSEALTRTGTVMGTPRYMAPEQHLGKPLTTAADQFAFCVGLWESLYDDAPFAGQTPHELVANILAGRMVAPARVRGVPGWLRRVCERGLTAEPTQRWPSMSALLDALDKGRARAGVRRGLAAVGVLALLGVAWQTHHRWDLARRTTACEESGGEVETAWSPARAQELRSALLATGVSYAAATVDKVVPSLEQHAEAWREARVEACLDADVRGQWDAETLERSLWCLDERRVALESLVDELTLADAEVLSKAVAAAVGLPPIAPCRDPKVLEALDPPPQEAREAVRAVRADVVRATNLERAGRYERGIELARAALERAEAVEWLPAAAAARYRLGSLLHSNGAYPEAEAELERAYFDAVEGEAPDVAFEAASLLASVVGVAAARYGEGRRWARLAALELRDVPDAEQLRRASMLVNLGLIHGATADYAEALRVHQEALDMREAALGPDHPYVANSLNNLAAVHFYTGSYDEAVRLFERSLAISRATLGHRHPGVADSLANLASMHQVLGDSGSAERLFEESLAITQETLGPEHPDVADTLNNLANVLSSTERRGDAKRLMVRSLAIREKAFGPEHPLTASSLHNLANLHYDDREYDEARRLHERALAIEEKTLGPEHPDVADSLVGLAEVALVQQRHADALALVERAVTLRENGAGPPELLAQARFTQARALWNAPEHAGRDRTRALALATQAGDDLRKLGPAGAGLLATIDPWLAKHTTPTE